MATHAHLIWLASRRDARLIRSFAAYAREATPAPATSRERSG